MVSFIEVDPATLNTDRLGRRGRVSYPLLKSFLEANIKLAKVDLTGFEKNPTYLRSVLTSYIKSHKLPIKIFAVQGDMHMMRLDMDNTGKPIEGWEYQEGPTEGAAGDKRNQEARPINSAEVASRFEQEKGQFNK